MLLRAGKHQKEPRSLCLVASPITAVEVWSQLESVCRCVEALGLGGCSACCDAASPAALTPWGSHCCGLAELPGRCRTEAAEGLD